jgi:hypothetical protein
VYPPLCQSIRIHKSIKLPDFAYSCYSSSFTSFLAFIHCLSKPFSYKEAILDPLWQQAMDEKLSTLYKTDTWDLVPLSPSKSVVGCHWVYRIKTNYDGSIERYKTRLVAGTIKELMSYPMCRSVKVINNSARPGSIHREVDYIYIYITKN